MGIEAGRKGAGVGEEGSVGAGEGSTTYISCDFPRSGLSVAVKMRKEMSGGWIGGGVDGVYVYEPQDGMSIKSSNFI